MSMNKEEFFNILREYASKEFEDIPQSDDEIDYEFSEEFEKKMEKLIDSIGNNKKPRKLNHRKAIAILIAAIIVAFAGAMSVGAIREPIVNFVVDKYEDFMDFLFEGDTSSKIEYVYSFQTIPPNFEETDSFINENTVHAEYVNVVTGDEIILEQRITDGSQGSLDTQNGEISTTMLDETKVYIYEYKTGDIFVARWTKETYSFTLTYYGDIDKEELIELIKSIS